MIDFLIKASRICSRIFLLQSALSHIDSEWVLLNCRIKIVQIEAVSEELTGEIRLGKKRDNDESEYLLISC